jgi:drug/metabolite transporter (DMT)-like permease
MVFLMRQTTLRPVTGQTSGAAAGLSPAVIGAALLAVVVWGGSPVGTKFAVASLPPLAVAALRTVLGGALALPLALALRVPPPLRGRQLVLLGLSSFGGFVGFPALFTVAMQSTSGIHGAMILAFLPVTTGAITHAVQRTLPRGRWWLGCSLAVAGEILLVVSRHGAGGQAASFGGDALALSSTLFASGGYVAGAKLTQSGYPSQGATYWGVGLAAVCLVPLLPWLLAGQHLADVPAAAIWGLAYLAAGVSVAGYVLWYWALARGGIARVGLFQFVQPLSGVLLAWALLAEPVAPPVLAAAALILAGVWIAARPAR